MEDGDTGRLTKDEMDALVADVVRFVVFRNYQQPGIPIKRTELVSIVTQGYRQHNLPNTVIAQAENQLKSVFGMDLRQLQKVQQDQKKQKDQQSSQQQQQQGSQRRQSQPKQAAAAAEYVLLSALPENLRKEFVNEPASNAGKALAVIFMAIVQLSGDRCTEENLWAHMQRLGLRDNEVHQVLGNPKNALDSVLKQKFLKKEKATDEDGAFVYILGDRALDEVVKNEVDNYISKLVRGDEPEDEDEEE